MTTINVPLFPLSVVYILSEKYSSKVVRISRYICKLSESELMAYFYTKRPSFQILGTAAQSLQKCIGNIGQLISTHSVHPISPSVSIAEILALSQTLII